mgnify:FL=1
MKGEVYGIAAFPVRESWCQAFHSINEIVGDMAEHLADSFDSNAAFLKGCIIKDGTSVILVGIHLMLPENGMEAKGNFGKKHSPVDAGVQKCAIQRVL